MRPKPFVKWAGGKGRLLSQLEPYFPKEYKRYYEPFLGGGAVFFYLTPPKATLNDSNEELMNMYTQVKDNLDDLMKAIDVHEPHKTDKDHFYDVRALDVKDLSDVERAARLIYLNRTCFNGLYRVDRQGRFNVPFGRTSTGNPPELYDTDRLLACSEALQKAKLLNHDYNNILRRARKGDFVYIDPPYHAPNKASMYSANGFNDEAQDKVARFFMKLCDRGALVLMNNSTTLELLKDEHSNIRELFEVDDYYRGVLGSQWSIGARAEWRIKKGEFVVANYSPQPSKQTKLGVS